MGRWSTGWVVAGVTAVALTVSGASEPVTFTHDIAPIVFDHCAGCHRPGEAGSFSLLTYGDVRARARQIAAVTARRYMPPWKPDRDQGPFLGARGLTPDEIARFARWIEDGTLEGRREDLPSRPTWVDGWQLGAPDLVVQLSEPFTLPAGGPDVIRNFVVPLPVAARRYVEALEFRPGNRRIAHHATMLIDSTSASRELDASDPLPGYEGILPYAAKQPDGHFLGWTPGEVALRADADMAWRLEPGSDLVVSMHMRPTGKPEVLQFSVGLFFGSRAPTRVPYIIQLGKQDLDIPPNAAAYTTEDRYVLPIDVEVRGVQPHAHYLCRRVEAWATLPDGTRRSLIAISDWDFAWQAQYRYATPLVLPKGTILSMRYVFDNSATNPRNPTVPPRRVTYGQGSVDEMAELLIQVLPRTTDDRAVLDRDFRIKATSDAIAGYEVMLKQHPDSVAMHNDAAMLYLEAGDANRAVTHFASTVRLTPGDRKPHYNLGVALAAADRLDEAIAAYRRALDLSPSYALAHNNLGAVLMRQGAFAEAVAEYRAAVAAAPDYADARFNLGTALYAEGRTVDAIAELRVAASAYAAAGELTRALAIVEAARELTARHGLTDLDAALARQLDDYRRCHRERAGSGVLKPCVS